MSHLDEIERMRDGIEARETDGMAEAAGGMTLDGTVMIREIPQEERAEGMIEEVAHDDRLGKTTDFHAHRSPRLQYQRKKTHQASSNLVPHIISINSDVFFSTYRSEASAKFST